MITSLFIFAGGLILGLIANPTFKLISEKRKASLSKSDIKAEVINEEKMVAIDGFDEDEYTSKYFNIADHSISTSPEEWQTVIDYREISFFKREGEKHDSPQLTMKIDYRTDNGLFKVNDKVRLSSSRGSYSSDYTICGQPSKELTTMAYKKYVEWVNRKNEEKKLEIDNKLKTFQSVLGKASERDMKLDELLNGGN